MTFTHKKKVTKTQLQRFGHVFFFKHQLFSSKHHQFLPYSCPCLSVAHLLLCSLSAGLSLIHQHMGATPGPLLTRYYLAYGSFSAQQWHWHGVWCWYKWLRCSSVAFLNTLISLLHWETQIISAQLWSCCGPLPNCMTNCIATAQQSINYTSFNGLYNEESFVAFDWTHFDRETL